jgi:hypothetical protein
MHHHAGQKVVHSETYFMKTQMKLILWFLTLVALLSAPHLASAYYDPGTQRWINRDPIQENGGINLYCFVEDDPNNAIDPLGLVYATYTRKCDSGEEKICKQICKDLGMVMSSCEVQWHWEFVTRVIVIDTGVEKKWVDVWQKKEKRSCGCRKDPEHPWDWRPPCTGENAPPNIIPLPRAPR